MTPDQDLNRQQALLDFLARFEAHCPRCRYDLRQLTTCRCPECGTELRLDVHAAKERLGWWITALIGAGLPGGLGVLYDIMLVVKPSPSMDLRIWTIIVSVNLALLMFIGIASFRLRFTGWKPGTQRAAAAASWLPTIMLIVCLVLDR